jgi:hypothetical protein
MLTACAARLFTPIALLVLLLAGAHGKAGELASGDVAGGGQVTVERQVSQRAAERWKSLIAKDFISAFGFFSPGMRAVVPFEYYRSKSAGAVANWVESEVESTNCERDVCSLVVRVTYIYKGGVDLMKDQTSSSLVREKWLLVDGAWWLVPDKL